MYPLAEQCSSTTRMEPHHCGLKTGAVLSSDEHRLALLVSYASSTAQIFCQKLFAIFKNEFANI